MRRHVVIFCLILLGLSASVSAGAQQTLVAPARSIDWTRAGAGTLPARLTQCGATIAAYTGTAATINTAIANCPAGQHVQLASGGFTLSSGILFSAKDNVTLRGSGPDATFLHFTGSTSCGGKTALICAIAADSADPADNVANTANWTAGYAQGSTTLTFSAKTNLQVGSVVLLDQLSDNGDADAGQVYICTTTPGCTQNGNGGGGLGRANRFQQQWVTVTSISAGACPCTIGITPGISMPNWRAAKSPGAWWINTLPITGVGIEALSLDQTNSGAPFNISFFNATNSWVKNIRSVRPISKHVLAFDTVHLTVRDSYFFATTNSVNDSYAVDFYMSGDSLVENNIAQRVAVPWMNEASAGNVFAYNYSINDLFDQNQTATSWMQGCCYHHGPSLDYSLWEGNDGAGLTLENYFGTAHFVSAFRNRFTGWETSTEENQTVAAHIYARNRYANLVGNVLGTSTYHTTYETIAGGSDTNCDHSIYAIGLGGNCSNGTGTGQSPTNDPNTLPTLMRWGNYDTVTATVRFVPSEVPSGLSLYANPVPATTSLPASFYLAAKPPFFGSVPWPAIGPDVTGGSEPNVGGHNAKIPARRCFETVMGGTFNDLSAKPFNATNCYATSTVPSAPTNLRIVK
jgi:hypothetical protein